MKDGYSLLANYIAAWGTIIMSTTTEGPVAYVFIVVSVILFGIHAYRSFK